MGYLHLGLDASQLCWLAWLTYRHLTAVKIPPVVPDANVEALIRAHVRQRVERELRSEGASGLALLRTRLAERAQAAKRET